MKDSDREEFARVMLGVAEVYDKPLSDEKLNLYWSALSSLSIEEVKAGLTNHMKNTDDFGGCRYPLPADIIRGVAGSLVDRAATAWSKVLTAMRSTGRYATVAFDDPIIHAVIREMGGWIDACGITEDEIPFRGKDFMTRYRGYSQRGGAADYPASLPGIEQITNEAKDPEYQPRVVLIGHPQTAYEVYKGGKAGADLLTTTLKLPGANSPLC